MSAALRFPEPRRREKVSPYRERLPPVCEGSPPERRRVVVRRPEPPGLEHLRVRIGPLPRSWRDHLPRALRVLWALPGHRPYLCAFVVLVVGSVFVAVVGRGMAGESCYR